jgi:hypothetical protein
MVPQGVNDMYLTWAMLGSIIGIVSVIFTTITALGGKYLQLSLAKAFHEFAANLDAKIDSKFASKEHVTGEMALLRQRLEYLSERVTLLENTKHGTPASRNAT